MKRFLLLVVTAPVLAAFLFGCGTPAPAVAERWEYKQLYAHHSDQQLNEYAKDGWVGDQVVKGREQNNEWVYFLLKRRVR